MLDGLRRIVLSPPVRIVAAVVVVWLLFAWFAVGPILKWAAPKYIAAHGERVLTIERAHFNPFRLALEIEGARLTEPDGAPLLAFERFLADFELASLVRGAWTFREIVLDAPSTLVALRADGSLNWLDFIAGFASDEPAPERDPGPPRLLVDRLAVTRGTADFSDRKFVDDFETRIEPIDFEVRELSTLPDEQGRHSLQLRTEIGAQLQWQGSLGLNPLLATGDVVLSDLVFERIWPYLEPRLAMAPPKGSGEIRFAYRLGYENSGMSMVVDRIAATITELGIAGNDAAEPGIRLDSIALAGGHFDLQARSASVESLDISGGRIAARRGADGAIDIASWFAPPADAAPAASEAPASEAPAAQASAAGTSTGDTPPAPATPAVSEATPATPPAGAPMADETWRFGIGRVGIDGIAVHYLDEGFARPLTADIGKLKLGFKVDGEAGGQAPQVEVREFGVELADISLVADGIEEPILGLAGANLESGGLDLAQRAVTIGNIRLQGAKLAAARDADGAIAVLDAFAPAASAAGGKPAAASNGAKPAVAAKKADEPAPVAASGDDAWRYQVGEVTLDGGQVDLLDASVKPAAALGLQDIHVAVRDISEDLGKKWPVEASFAVRDGGKFTAKGAIVAGAPSGELELRLSGLGLGIAQPYLSEFARLRIAGGSLASAGRLRFGDGKFRYDGSVDIGDLDLHELDTKATLLGWKSLSTRKLSVREDRVEIGELLLDSLRSKLIIFEDRSVNVARVIGPAEPAGQGQAAAAAREAKEGGKNAQAAAGKPAFRVGIERLRLVNGDVDFADLSLALPFGTRIHELKGELAGLSNDPDSASTIALDGKVDEYGSAKVGGEINLFAPAEHTDAKVEFRNVEMTNLTPYSATFAGRRIASGKLSLDLEYKIAEKQLQGDNRILMEQLTLGEKVESEDAPDLPLDLALAILKDSQGRIDLGLPVSGSLEDPQFSFGGLIGKALLGLVTKIVTAPFRALGALFGGGEDVDMSQIAFDAGSAELSGREREKLARLAEALGKRPNLALEIEPGVNPEVDGRALRDVQLRREIAGRLGRSIKAGDDPGPLAMGDGATRSALDGLFIERFNAHELKQLRQAAPEAAGGDAAGGEGDEARDSAPAAGASATGDDAAKPKPAGENNAYRKIFERLRDAETLDEAAMAALGKQRGEAIRAELEAKGLAAGRMKIAAPADREAKDGAVLVGLGLDAQGSAGGAPAASSDAAPAGRH